MEGWMGDLVIGEIRDRNVVLIWNFVCDIVSQIQNQVLHKQLIHNITKVISHTNAI